MVGYDDLVWVGLVFDFIGKVVCIFMLEWIGVGVM